MDDINIALKFRGLKIKDEKARNHIYSKHYILCLTERKLRKLLSGVDKRWAIDIQ